MKPEPQDTRFGPDLPSGGSSATKITTALGLTLIAVTFLLFRWPTLQARIAMMSIGVFVGSLAVFRPPGFWDVPSVRSLRDAITDWGVLAIYFSIGVAAVVFAWVARI